MFMAAKRVIAPQDGVSLQTGQFVKSYSIAGQDPLNLFFVQGLFRSAPKRP
jgi:hypothetical protein